VGVVTRGGRGQHAGHRSGNGRCRLAALRRPKRSRGRKRASASRIHAGRPGGSPTGPPAWTRADTPGKHEFRRPARRQRRARQPGRVREGSEPTSSARFWDEPGRSCRSCVPVSRVSDSHGSESKVPCRGDCRRSSPSGRLEPDAGDARCQAKAELSQPMHRVRIRPYRTCGAPIESHIEPRDRHPIIRIVESAGEGFEPPPGGL